jgi:DNA helicase HerA-like ATPase
MAFVMLDLDTRRRHLYVIGQTSTSKSTLLLNLIAQDLAAGQGFAALDPRGDIAETVLLHVPRNRSNLIIPRQRVRRVGRVEPALRLLWEASTPDERHQRRHEVR